MKNAQNWKKHYPPLQFLQVYGGRKPESTAEGGKQSSQKYIRVVTKGLLLQGLEGDTELIHSASDLGSGNDWRMLEDLKSDPISQSARTELRWKDDVSG